MEIDFKDKKFKALCEQEKLAQRKLGEQMARNLQARLADLIAASSITELCAGHPHSLKGDRAGQYALELVQPKRLVFEPDHDPVPRLKDGGIDWSRITQVRIIWIGDYHD
ncbi:MAG: hypothetical protein RH949_17675 [Coleofasciculus sp. A1-SPW-01]|uniref:type II toxin-antitoxin system RelE/ParE family toxin n=1 Tax=Coleofasciculus sp. A1-SPW-01 TaxID=3070819 RepID=UPI0032F2DA96